MKLNILIFLMELEQKTNNKIILLFLKCVDFFLMLEEIIFNKY